MSEIFLILITKGSIICYLLFSLLNMHSVAKLAVIALAALNVFNVDARPTPKPSASITAATTASATATANNSTTDSRAAAIQEAFLHAWNGYSKYAFGHDELLSVSNKPSDSR
jgi:hypothetical protein